jgi:HEAT repeat protein
MAKKTTRSTGSALVIAAAVGALFSATCSDARGKPAPAPATAPASPPSKQAPKGKGTTMTFDEAVAQLRTPARWCDASEALVKIGDRRAIEPLYRVAALTEEGLPDRRCVKDALQALGAQAEARSLVTSTTAETRRMAITMLKWFPADENLPALEQVVWKDGDGFLRSYAAGAILVHKVTPAWQASMIRLLDAPDAEARRTTVMALHHRFGDAVLAALRKRHAVETEADIKASLAQAIQTHEARAKKP